MKNTNREELVEELNLYSKKSKEIRKQIDEIDYKNRLTDALQYEGKCYQENNEVHKESIRCLYVYGTDKEQCRPKALSLSYWTNDLSSYFSIEYRMSFDPKKWEEDTDDWTEITKEAYMEHYNQVQKRISLAIA